MPVKHDTRTQAQKDLDARHGIPSDDTLPERQDEMDRRHGIGRYAKKSASGGGWGPFALVVGVVVAIVAVFGGEKD